MGRSIYLQLSTPILNQKLIRLHYQIHPLINDKKLNKSRKQKYLLRFCSSKHKIPTSSLYVINIISTISLKLKVDCKQTFCNKTYSLYLFLVMQNVGNPRKDMALQWFKAWFGWGWVFLWSTIVGLMVYTISSKCYQGFYAKVNY